MAVLSLGSTTFGWDSADSNVRVENTATSAWTVSAKSNKSISGLQIVNGAANVDTLGGKSFVSRFNNLNFRYGNGGGLNASRADIRDSFITAQAGNNADSLSFNNVSGSSIVAQLRGGSDTLSFTNSNISSSNFDLGAGADSVVFNPKTTLSSRTIINLGDADGAADTVSFTSTSNNKPYVLGARITNFETGDTLRIGSTSYTGTQLQQSNPSIGYVYNATTQSGRFTSGLLTGLTIEFN